MAAVSVYEMGNYIYIERAGCGKAAQRSCLIASYVAAHPTEDPKKLKDVLQLIGERLVHGSPVPC